MAPEVYSNYSTVHCGSKDQLHQHVVLQRYGVAHRSINDSKNGHFKSHWSYKAFVADLKQSYPDANFSQFQIISYQRPHIIIPLKIATSAAMDWSASLISACWIRPP